MAASPSPTILAAIQAGATEVYPRCDVYEIDGDTPWMLDAPIVDGSLSVDWTRDERRMLSISFANNDLAFKSRPSSRNLIVNPSFEDPITSPWSIIGGATFGSTEQAKFGTKSGKVTGGPVSGFQYAISGLNTSITYTLSMYFYIPSTSSFSGGGNRPWFDLYNFGGQRVYADKAYNARDTWKREFITFTPTSTSGIIRILQDSGSAVPWFVDGVLLEEGTNPSKFGDRGGFWYDKILKLYKGARYYDSNGVKQTYELQCGEFLIDDIDMDTSPRICAVTTRDRTKTIIESEFATSTTFSAGVSLESVVNAIAVAAGVPSNRINLPLTGVNLLRDVTFESKSGRWKAISDLCTTYGWSAYFDNTGMLTMVPFADPYDPAVSPTVFTFEPGGRNIKNGSFEEEFSNGDQYLSVPLGGYLSTGIKSTNLSTQRDLDIRADLQLLDWTPAEVATVIGNSSPASLGWAVVVLQDGRLDFSWSTDGSTVIQNFSTSPGFTDGDRWMIRITFHTENDSTKTIKFYKKAYSSTAALLDDTGWQLINTTTSTNTNPIFASIGPGFVGAYNNGNTSRMNNGRVFGIAIKSGINGSTITNLDFSRMKSLPYTDQAGDKWWPVGNAGLSANRHPLWWTPDWDVQGGSYYTTIESDGQQRSGNNALKLVVGDTASGTGAASKSIAVNPGDVWQITTWSKAVPAMSSGKFIRVVFGATEDPNLSNYTNLVDLSSNAAWTSEYSQDIGLVTVPAGAAWMRVVVYAWSSTGAYVGYWDDMETKRLSPTDDTKGNIGVPIKKKTSSSRIKNHVIASSESATTVPVFAEAINNNPSSPTSVSRLRAHKTFFYSSPLLTTNAQCLDVATRLLKVQALESYEASVNAIVMPWLEPGSVVGFDDPDGSPGDPVRYLLDSYNMPLRPGFMPVQLKRVTIVG